MSVTIAELNYAPGKSMAMYDDVEALTVDHLGLFGDRHCMWVVYSDTTNWVRV